MGPNSLQEELIQISLMEPANWLSERLVDLIPPDELTVEDVNTIVMETFAEWVYPNILQYVDNRMDMLTENLPSVNTIFIEDLRKGLQARFVQIFMYFSIPLPEDPGFVLFYNIESPLHLSIGYSKAMALVEPIQPLNY